MSRAPTCTTCFVHKIKSGVFSTCTCNTHLNVLPCVQEEQACGTALILACSSAASDREVSQWATRAFFRSDGDFNIFVIVYILCKLKAVFPFVVGIRYGGEAQMRFPAAMTTPSTVGPVMSSPAPGKLVNLKCLV